jgi:amidohydrolase
MQDEVRQRMERIAAGVTQAFGASYRMEYRVPAPVTANDVGLTRSSVPVLKRILGPENVLEPKPQMGAEDFSYFAREIPGFYFFLGVSNQQKGITADLHTPEFDVDETAIPLGVRLMSALIIQYLEENG